nr:ketopantoate reductase C-terminal domain-containing protein [Bacillus safensis]
MIYTDEWKKVLEEKLLVNVCINPLTALLHVKNGELIANPSYEYMMKCAFEEALSILGLPEKERLWSHVVSICKKTYRQSIVNASRYRQSTVKPKEKRSLAIF